MKIKYLPLLLSLSALAQAPPNKSIQQPNQLPPASLTELESTKLQLLETQNALLRTQEDQLKARYNQLVADIQAAHPGYQFIQQTGQLAPLPKPAEVSKPEAKK